MSEQLEEKITTALNNPNTGSADLIELISEAEAAATAADQAAREARAAAVDIATRDPSAAHQTVIISELLRDRLKAILMKLRDKFAELKSAENAAKWDVAFKRMNAANHSRAPRRNATRRLRRPLARRQRRGAPRRLTSPRLTQAQRSKV